jgi:hypothetical protein
LIYNTGITSIFQNLPVSAILVLPVFSRIFQYLQYWYYQYFPESSDIYNTHILANTGYTSIADIGRLGRIPVNPSFYVYIILKELNIIHAHTSESSGIYNTHILAMTSIF